MGGGRQQPDFGAFTVSLRFGPVVARKVADDRDRPAAVVHPARLMAGAPYLSVSTLTIEPATRLNPLMLLPVRPGVPG